MNNRIKTLICLIGLLPTLYGCGSSTNGFTSSSTSSSNVISAGNFSIGFSSSTVSVLAFSTAPTGSVEPCTNLTGIDGSLTSTITATAADKNNALVSSGRVYFKVEFGSLDKNYCDLQNGQCSVEWSAQTNISTLTSAQDTFDCLSNKNGTVDVFNSVTAWTYGAEHFTDNDGDGRLSDAETYIDIGEPYLDRNDNSTYDAAVDDLTSADTNGTYDPASGTYNGPDCDSTTRADCGGANLIPIFFNAYIVLF